MFQVVKTVGEFKLVGGVDPKWGDRSIVIENVKGRNKGVIMDDEFDNFVLMLQELVEAVNAESSAQGPLLPGGGDDD